MTNEELRELVEDCPVLYHMAEPGSWPSIRDQGLMSTAALLDTYGINGARRKQIEEIRRPAGVELNRPGLPRAVVRDQIPMDDRGLERCLPPHLNPSDWYKLLNQKVFFWLTRDRLTRLLNARAYRERTYVVLEVQTAALIREFRNRIWLCPINSGCTKPFPHPRDETTFRRIVDYPYAHWKQRRRKGERVVELCVDYAVPQIADLVLRVTEVRADQEIRVLFEA